MEQGIFYLKLYIYLFSATISFCFSSLSQYFFYQGLVAKAMLVFMKSYRFKLTKGKKERKESSKQIFLLKEKKNLKTTNFAFRRFIAFTIHKMLNFTTSYISWLGYREILRKSRFEIESWQQPRLGHKEPQHRGQSLRVLPLGSHELK